jgi:hypothetical protein
MIIYVISARRHKANVHKATHVIVVTIDNKRKYDMNK